MPPAYLLCDLDETLYPTSCGLMQAVSARMSAFVAEYLRVDREEAARIRSRLRVTYGTTLTGLMREYGLQVAEQYLAYTHDVPVADFLAEDPLPLRGPGLHPPAQVGAHQLPAGARRAGPEAPGHPGPVRAGLRPALQRLSSGKPDPAVYNRALGALGRRAAEVLLVDNHLDYLAPFRAMGGQVLLIDEGGDGSAQDGVPTLGDIKELPAYLAALEAASRDAG